MMTDETQEWVELKQEEAQRQVLRQGLISPVTSDQVFERQKNQLTLNSRCWLVTAV